MSSFWPPSPPLSSDRSDQQPHHRNHLAKNGRSLKFHNHPPSNMVSSTTSLNCNPIHMHSSSHIWRCTSPPFWRPFAAQYSLSSPLLRFVLSLSNSAKGCYVSLLKGFEGIGFLFLVIVHGLLMFIIYGQISLCRLRSPPLCDCLALFGYVSRFSKLKSVIVWLCSIAYFFSGVCHAILFPLMDHTSGFSPTDDPSSGESFQTDESYY